MSKSVRHYRRHFEAVAGEFAAVRAYRYEPDGFIFPRRQVPAPGVMVYRVRCLLCGGDQHPDIAPWNIPGEFHLVMHDWAAHMRLVHPDLPQPDYELALMDSDRRAADLVGGFVWSLLN